MTNFPLLIFEKYCSGGLMPYDGRFLVCGLIPQIIVHHHRSKKSILTDILEAISVQIVFKSKVVFAKRSVILLNV